MLAARGERTLADDKNFIINKWLAIDEKYFFRYAEDDKKYVKERLSEYKELAQEFFSYEVNVQSVQGFFDDRPVVLREMAICEQVL